MPRITEMSIKRQRIVDFIREYQLKTSMNPSIRDIMEGVGISSTSVVKYDLKQLEELGFLHVVPRVARGIILIPEASFNPPVN